MTDSHEAPELLAALKASSGGYTMLALDQRESLRQMFEAATGSEVGDETLRTFKSDAISALTPWASAVLLDRPYAFDGAKRPRGLADSCALIVAADILHQPAGQTVSTTSLDPVVDVDFLHTVGAAAAKFLVIWRADGSAAEREDLVGSFIELSKQAGVASLVEGIVRPAGGDVWVNQADRHEAIIDAAVELASYGGDVYKAEVPGYRPGDVSSVKEHSERLTAQVSVPWVVLSNGVDQDDFPVAVRESMAGGASGFLAGRAVWSDTIFAPSPADALRTRSVTRLQNLDQIVSDSVTGAQQSR